MSSLLHSDLHMLVAALEVLLCLSSLGTDHCGRLLHHLPNLLPLLMHFLTFEASQVGNDGLVNIKIMQGPGSTPQQNPQIASIPAQRPLMPLPHAGNLPTTHLSKSSFVPNHFPAAVPQQPSFPASQLRQSSVSTSPQVLTPFFKGDFTERQGINEILDKNDIKVPSVSVSKCEPSKFLEEDNVVQSSLHGTKFSSLINSTDELSRSVEVIVSPKMDCERPPTTVTACSSVESVQIAGGSQVVTTFSNCDIVQSSMCSFVQTCPTVTGTMCSLGASVADSLNPCITSFANYSTSQSNHEAVRPSRPDSVPLVSSVLSADSTPTPPPTPPSRPSSSNSSAAPVEQNISSSNWPQAYFVGTPL